MVDMSESKPIMKITQAKLSQGDFGEEGEGEGDGKEEGKIGGILFSFLT